MERSTRANMRQKKINLNSDDLEESFAWSMDKVAVEEYKEDFTSQMSSLLRGSKSKYSSVAEAVEEMKARSGLTNYLSRIKMSEKKNLVEKIAQEQMSKSIPNVIKSCPQIENTIKNYIESTHGHTPLMAIIERVKEIHRNDVSDPKEWNDEKLYRLISTLNMEEKAKRFEQHAPNTLGKEDDLSISNFMGSDDPFAGIKPNRE